jgi:hypothetical protein
MKITSDLEFDRPCEFAQINAEVAAVRRKRRRIPPDPAIYCFTANRKPFANASYEQHPLFGTDTVLTWHASQR